MTKFNIAIYGVHFVLAHKQKQLGTNLSKLISGFPHPLDKASGMTALNEASHQGSYTVS